MSEVVKQKTCNNTMGGILRLSEEDPVEQFSFSYTVSFLVFTLWPVLTISSCHCRIFTVHPINNRDCNRGNGGSQAGRKLSL